MRKEKLQILIILILLSSSLFAEIGIKFDHQFDGDNYEDMGACVTQTTDGGFIVGGNKYIGGGNTPEVMVIKKLDEDGNEDWSKDIYKGWEYLGDHLTDLIEVKNSSGDNDGYILCGSYISPNDFPKQKGSIIKLNDEGDELFFTSIPYNEVGVSGVTQVKPNKILQTEDRDFLVAGYIVRNSQKDFYLARASVVGTLLWQKTFSDGSDDIIKDIITILDENGDFSYYLALGNIDNDNEGNDYKLMKFSDEGDIIESFIIEGGVNEQLGSTITETSDKGFIISGSTKFSDGKYKARITKLNSDFEITWDNLFGTDTGTETALGVYEDITGNFIAAGNTDSYGAKEIDMLVLKIDANGNEIFHSIYGGNENDFISSFNKTDTDFEYIATGWTFSNISGGYEDMWVVNFEDISPSNIEGNYELGITNYELKQNYPNPFNPTTRINYELGITNYELAEIVVYNAMGQEIWSKNLLSNPSSLTPNTCTFDGSKFNSGIYYYSLIIDNKIISTKSMVLIK